MCPMPSHPRLSVPLAPTSSSSPPLPLLLSCHLPAACLTYVPLFRYRRVHGGRDFALFVCGVTTKGRLEDCDISGGDEEGGCVSIGNGADPLFAKCRYEERGGDGSMGSGRNVILQPGSGASFFLGPSLPRGWP